MGFCGTAGSGAFSGSFFSGAGAGGWGVGFGFGISTGTGAGFGAETVFGGWVAHPKAKTNAAVIINRTTDLIFTGKISYLLMNFF
jgi:hypothetical protein